MTGRGGGGDLCYLPQARRLLLVGLHGSHVDVQLVETAVAGRGSVFRSRCVERSSSALFRRRLTAELCWFILPSVISPC